MIFLSQTETKKLLRIGFYLLIAFFLCSLRARTKPAAEVVIIANSSVPTETISADDLRSIFLGTKTCVRNGNRLVPVFRKGGAVHEAFLREYLGKTESALQIYYRSLVFSGTGSMPTTLASDSEVIAFVEKNRGAIGYVEGNADLNGVKRLKVK